MTYIQAQNFVTSLCQDYRIKPLSLKLTQGNVINAHLHPLTNKITMTSYSLTQLPGQLIKALLAHEVGHEVLYSDWTFSPYTLNVCFWLLILFYDLLFIHPWTIKLILCILIIFLDMCMNATLSRHCEYRADYFSVYNTSLSIGLRLLGTASKNNPDAHHQFVLSKHPSVENRKKYLLKFF